MLCRLQKAIASFLGLALCLASVHGQDLSSATLAQVEQRLAEKGTAAWELGTRTQALLELTAEQYSVFNTQNAPNIPPPASIPSSLVAPLNVITGIARTVVNNRPNTTGYHDAQPLFYDNLSVGDPCSMGVAVLLANWTRAGGADFVGAAQEQLNYLLNVAPRSPQGAISHRNGVVELWSDNVYMVPPFLAYYGAMTNNQSLIQDAYQQINLYRNALRDGNKTTAGLWFHVVMGPRLDYGHWSTGMGWAAAGMMRVYATIANSRFSNSMQSQKTDISNWVNEIHGAIYPRLDPSGLFRNYADNKTDFLDSSGAALIAASVYRTAVLTKYTKWIPSAEITRKALFSTNADGSLKHFDANGWLTPVVDPYSPGVAGAMSPEGEGFVLELHSAYQDWVKAGSIGI